MNAYQEVTEKIIKKMQAGEIPWQKPWARILGQAVKHSDGTSYSVLNQLLLGRTGEFITFAQAKAEGGHIKKGAKSTTIYLWRNSKEKDGDRKEKAAASSPEESETASGKKEDEDGYWFLKRYQVFGIDDAEGVKPRWSDPLPENPADPDRTAEVFLSSYLDCQPSLQLKPGEDASYDESSDTVFMPEIIRFRSKELYYKTLFHQMAHSTGSAERLSRQADRIAFRDDHASREDLLAEICSAMVCSFAGLDVTKTVEDTAAYIEKWIPALRKDPRMIVWASRRAEEAARYIMNDSFDN